MDTERYQALMDAAKLISKASATLNKEDGAVTSPAWEMVHHAQRYCESEARKVLRAEEVSA